MAIDTPAKLGIIGAGPSGLEACLYARFLGYDVVLYECGQIAELWQSDSPLGRFGDFSSTLGRAALAAQNPDQPLPPLTEVLTCRQWREAYLVPLAECDLVDDCLRIGVKVTRVSKEHLTGDEVTGFDRGGYDFVVETADAAGVVKNETVDALIDASGLPEEPGNKSALFNYELVLDLKLRSDSPFLLPRIDYGDELPDGTKLTEDAQKLVLHEPNFYVLGEKSHGDAACHTRTTFERFGPGGALRYSSILDQIRAIFTILGDRTTLDLYATAVKLPQWAIFEGELIHGFDVDDLSSIPVSWKSTNRGSTIASLAGSNAVAAVIQSRLGFGNSIAFTNRGIDRRVREGTASQSRS